MTTAFEQHLKVLFRHCDPAGIVFFPRYFEMMNDCIEAFFAEKLGHPFEDIHQHAAVPTAQIETRFVKPSRHGDLLCLRLGIVRVGRSSVTYEMTATCAEEPRFVTKATLVYVDSDGVPAPLPKPLRDELAKYEVTQDAP